MSTRWLESRSESTRCFQATVRRRTGKREAGECPFGGRMAWAVWAGLAAYRLPIAQTGSALDPIIFPTGVERVRYR